MLIFRMASQSAASRQRFSGLGQIYYMSLFIGLRVLTLVYDLSLSSTRCGCTIVSQAYLLAFVLWKFGQANARPTMS